MSIKPNTKKILADSLEELLKYDSLEDITVTKIISNCNASRSVFYKHFKDKYDLMIWIYINQIGKSKNRNNVNTWRELSLEVYSYIYEKKDYFKNIIKYKNQNNFLEFLYSYCCEYFDKILYKELEVNKLPLEIDVSVKMYSASMIFLVKEWISDDFKENVETIASLSCDNIPVPLSKYFK